MVRHILKDGTVLADITGHIVKMEDAKATYELMNKINKDRRKAHDGRTDD